jgi:proteasome accessory factor C
VVSLRVSDLRWARRLVLGLGPGVSVVSPPALVDAVRAEARAALTAYEPPPADISAGYPDHGHPDHWPGDGYPTGDHAD